jgi:hypothetical protein
LPRSPTTAGRHHHEACLPERRAWFSLDPRYLDYDLARRIHHGGRVRRSGSSWLALELLELGSDPGEWHDLLA